MTSADGENWHCECSRPPDLTALHTKMWRDLEIQRLCIPKVHRRPSDLKDLHTLRGGEIYRLRDFALRTYLTGPLISELRTLQDVERSAEKQNLGLHCGNIRRLCECERRCESLKYEDKRIHCTLVQRCRDSSVRRNNTSHAFTSPPRDKSHSSSMLISTHGNNFIADTFSHPHSVRV